MTLTIVRFIALFLAAVGFGLTLAHVLEAPGERALTGAAWLAVQHNYYGGFAIAGGIAEVVGLIATLVILYLVRHRRALALWTLVAALGPLAMLIFYFIGNAPLNAQIASWTAATLPSGWEQTREAWSNWHTASAVAACVWLVILLITTLRDTRAKDSGE